MEEGAINIRVTVGGRVYSLRVGMEEEEFVRRGAEMVDKKIQELQSSYSVSDDKDLLAMTALQLGSERARAEKEGEAEQEHEKEALERLEERIAAYLKEGKGND
ncbi:MAG: cell division protein ZapA [Flavobacteriales bacterium]